MENTEWLNAVSRGWFALHGGHGADAAWLDGLDHWLGSLEALWASGASWKFLPGLQALPNIHPLLVHFPIVLLPLFLVLDLEAAALRHERLAQLAAGMLYLGTISAVATIATGLQAGATVAHGPAVHAILERHEQIGVTVAALAVGLSLWRLIAHGRYSAIGRGLHLAIAGVMVALLVVGADLGGYMVYGHGVGVRAVPVAPADLQHHHSE